MNRRRTIVGLIVGLTLVIASVGSGAWYVHEGLRRASKMADFGLWSDARSELDRYLWLFPHDDRAHVLYAEMLVKDEDLTGPAAIDSAIEHLHMVPDSAPLGPIARLQEGRIEFLVLNRPTRAEKLLSQAVALDPHATDAYRVLWKLYDQTGRSHLAEPLFREVYAQEEWPERVYRLREWYMSQFYPSTANPTLDRMMGLVPEAKVPTESIEAYRFIRFRNEEPDAPLGYAALARWFHLEGDLEFAQKTLNDGREKMVGEEHDPFFLHTQIDILIKLGEHEQAGEVFDDWPQPGAGYEYWLSRATVFDEVRGEFQEAVVAYDKALAIWPGPIDWRTMNRKATCLRRLGDQDGAAKQVERAGAMEKLMRNPVHQRIREALGFLNDRKKVREIEDFYRKLDRDFEADSWHDHLTQLVAGKTIQPGPRLQATGTETKK